MKNTSRSGTFWLFNNAMAVIAYKKHACKRLRVHGGFQMSTFYRTSTMFVWNVKYSPGETDRFGETEISREEKSSFYLSDTKNPPLAIVRKYEKGQENYLE